MNALRLACLAGVLLSASTTVVAEEGMYPISDIARLNLQAKGLEMAPSDLFNPNKTCLIDGICRVNGCTGSFVSPNGLVVTNHHCAYRAIQSASTAERDLLKNGFQAKNLGEEIPGTWLHDSHHRIVQGRVGRSFERRETRHGLWCSNEGRHQTTQRARTTGRKRQPRQASRSCRDVYRQDLRSVPLHLRQRRATRVRSAVVRRQLWWRHRQLGMAASHRRLLVHASLRRLPTVRPRTTQRRTCRTSQSGSSRSLGRA